MSVTVPTPELQLPKCDRCGNLRGPWQPSGDLYPSGAQVLVCSDGCQAVDQMARVVVDQVVDHEPVVDHWLCGARRPGWDQGPAIGRHRIPCVRASHDDDGDHRNGLGETWPQSCQDCGTAEGPLEFLTISDPDGGLRDGHLCQACNPPIDHQELEVTRVFARTTNFTMAEGTLPTGELVRLVHLADGRSVVVVDSGQVDDHRQEDAAVIPSDGCHTAV